MSSDGGDETRQKELNQREQISQTSTNQCLIDILVLYDQYVRTDGVIEYSNISVSNICCDCVIREENALTKNRARIHR